MARGQSTEYLCPIDLKLHIFNQLLQFYVTVVIKEIGAVRADN